MSELKRYSCTVIVDASAGFNVEASSPEDAAEKAECLAAESGATSICHQCSANLDIGDFCGVMVYDEDLGEQVLDTTYGSEQIARLILERDALAAQRDGGLAREAELKAQRDSLANEMFDLQQRLAEAEKDAARYRWLRDRPLDGSEPFWIAVSSDDVYQTRCWALGGSSPDTCDRAIDKAMSSAGLVGQEQPS